MRSWDPPEDCGEVRTTLSVWTDIKQSLESSVREVIALPNDRADAAEGPWAATYARAV
jgi:hypothetical protein